MRSRFVSALAAASLVLAACNTAAPGASSTAGTSGSASSPSAAAPEELVIGFVPSQEAGALVEDIKPLADHLSQELGIPVEGIVSNDYAGLVTAMETGQAHVGAFGPFAMLQAVDRADAEIILQSERNGSATYHTQFFTNNPDKYCTDEPVENERDIEGETVTFLNCNGTARESDESPVGPIGIESLSNVDEGTDVAFVEQGSASGYIFPATIFAVAGLDPETAINPVFAGGHPASVIAVCEGQAEVGVSFDDARTGAETDCDVENEVVVFAYGPEIPNDGFAVAGSLPDDMKEGIKQALLGYAETEEGKETLDKIYEIDALTEPNLEALEIVRDAAEQLGITSD